MPIDATAVFLSLRKAVGHVCPELIPNSIYEAEQAEMIARTALRAPFGVIDLADLPGVVDRGADNLGFRIQADLYLLYENRGPASPLLTKLFALASYLQGRVLDVGRVEEVSRPMVGDQIPANAILATTGSTFRAGRLTVTLLVMSD